MQKKAFTLLEIIVALTIFSIFMVSMIMIYASSANIDRKIEINRAMQENTKNIVETIAEDVRKYKIQGVSTNLGGTCDFSLNYGKFKKGDKLCFCKDDGCLSTFSYYLAIYDNVNSEYFMVNYSDISSMCGDLTNECVLIKEEGLNKTKLSNSRVRFTDLKFLVSNEGMPKVTIIYEMQPSIKKGVRYETIKNSKLNFQTTITSRIIKAN